VPRPRPSLSLVLLLLVAVAACPRARPAGPVAFGPAEDAPWELADDTGWNEVRDQLFGLPPGAAERGALRTHLAAAQVARITRWLEGNRPVLAHEAMLELARLWSDEPQALGAELAGQAAALERARATFARGGADREVVLALVLLGEIEPAAREARWAEIEEVLAYADDLATAEMGPAALRSRPLEILEPIAHALPLPRVTDRFVALAAARQTAVSAALASDGASFELVRAHGAVLKAARALAAALARGGRAAEIAGQLTPLTGIGSDELLARRAAAVAGPGATARDWVLLARAFRTGDGTDDDDEGDDPESARAICLTGLRHFPDDPTLLAAAGRAAIALGRVHEPIRLFEALRRRVPGDRAVASQLMTLYRDRLAALAYNDRPVEARARLAELETFHQAVARAHPGRSWKKELATAFTAVGRGMVGQGELEDAIALLSRAVQLERDPEAYEMLATVALKRQRYGEARRFAEPPSRTTRSAASTCAPGCCGSRVTPPPRSASAASPRTAGCRPSTSGGWSAAATSCRRGCSASCSCRAASCCGPSTSGRRPSACSRRRSTSTATAPTPTSRWWRSW
jgi:tetratricopeptide (TPR) repeat protein